jgi:hypothetical protein
LPAATARARLGLEHRREHAHGGGLAVGAGQAQPRRTSGRAQPPRELDVTPDRDARIAGGPDERMVRREARGDDDEVHADRQRVGVAEPDRGAQQLEDAARSRTASSSDASTTVTRAPRRASTSPTASPTTRAPATHTDTPTQASGAARLALQHPGGHWPAPAIHSPKNVARPAVTNRPAMIQNRMTIGDLVPADHLEVVLERGHPEDPPPGQLEGSRPEGRPRA